MSEELSPCPFCGGLRIVPVEQERRKAAGVCLGCGAQGPLVAIQPFGTSDVIAAWNRRANDE